MELLECKKSRGVWKYTTESFEFKLVDEKLHDYKTLILTPKHLKILKNKSDRSKKDLEDYIIGCYFAHENADVREHNNKVARLRRQKNAKRK
jgi:hypothetical protein